MEQKLGNKKQPSILIVDDTLENLRYLNELLSRKGYDVRGTPDPQLALNVAVSIQPDIILLDIKMPLMNGYELAQALHDNIELQDIPIVFISGLDDVQDKIKAFEAGGVDYITKPFEEKEVLARVEIHLQLYRSKQHIESLLQQQDYFTKKIMHEMNTPVSVIMLNAQTLEAEIGKHPTIDTIKASAKILSSIYDDLNYLVKNEQYTYEPTWITLVDFISDRIAYFHEIAEVKKIELYLEIEAEFMVYINPLHLERLVDNTISNAIKYSHDNTEVELFIGKDKNNFFLSITDQGVGIEDVTVVFEQYYQSSQYNNGLGIGLAIVQEICENYNIDIQIKSKKNEGTIFTFVFTHNMVKQI